MKLLITSIAMVFLYSSSVFSADHVTFENVVATKANTPDEPLAKQFSLAKAEHFLDSASVQWTKKRKCFTCHTNFAYLMAKPSLKNDVTHDLVRSALETMVEQRWQHEGPRWDAEVVMSAMVLAFNDAKNGKKLHRATRVALDRMWTVQQDDGGFDWLKCGWPPMESDDHYGATVALIAAGVAPEEYDQSDAAKQGIKKLKQYLSKNPPPGLHHQAMTLWASTYIEDLLTNDQKQQIIKELLAQQKADGGWCLAALGNWERADKKEQDTISSDGYATGFVLYVLRNANVSPQEKSMLRGIQWLKSNQRESGRWYTRSLNRDNHHFISHAGSAFAVLALKSFEVGK